MARLPVVSESSEKAKAHKEHLENQMVLRAGDSFAGNALVVTLGCSKNLVDSEVMLGALRSRGFRSVTEPEQADVIVVNTCAFLKSAVEEGIDRILEMAKYKTTARCRKLIVAGCMVERYRDELKKSLPEVDRFISTDELLTVADENSTSEQCFSEARRPYFIYDESMPRVRSTGALNAYVKISEGCNRPCAFCIIPKIRGAMRSRSVLSVSQEIEDLYRDGVREFNFVAQDLTAYGTDFEGNRGIVSELPRLLQAVTEGPLKDTSSWIRLFYAYPVGVTEELIRLITQTPQICNYLDIPLQHASASVLKRMRRPLGGKGTRNLVEMIRTIAPELALRTTFVMGFPGETEEDVRELEEFVKEGHFTHVGAFAYSQEEEADSFHFENQVPEELREERKARIMLAQQEVLAKTLEAHLDNTERVMIQGAHADTDMLLVGRTEWQGPETDGEIIINEIDERVSESDIQPGRFGLVEIEEVAGYDLVGKLISIERD